MPSNYHLEDDQNKDGFKFENVRPTFSNNFRCRNTLKIGCTIFWFNLCVNFFLISDLEINSKTVFKV